MDYQKFKLDYERSCLTQAEYGKKIGKSASMVNYYLRRARMEQREVEAPSFSKLEVLKQDHRHIKIRTTSGVEIEIPL